LRRGQRQSNTGEITVEIQTDALLIARLILASVFFVAGAAKLLDLAGSRAAITAFGLPKILATPLGIALPILELLVAIALIPATTARIGAGAALFLLIVFIAGIASVMLKGSEAECHCFGQLHSSRVGWATLVRNVALAFLTMFVIFASGETPPGYIERIASISTTGLAALAAGFIGLAVLSVVAWFMVNLLRQHGRLLLRLDTLEAQLAAQGIVAYPARMGPPDGLIPGTTAPTFSLSGLDGGSDSLDGLLSAGLPLLLVFSHPGCTPCQTMLPALHAWQTAHVSALTIALISEGSDEDNRSASEHGIEHILIQRERETAHAYEAYATPSAVVVTRDGMIGSHVVQGEAAIRLLIDATVLNSRSNTVEDERTISSRPQWSDKAPSPIQPIGLDAH
jgi:thiol-disulfide isomerase/thioredoxin